MDLFGRILAELDEQRQKIRDDAFRMPCSDYAAYMKAFGGYQALSNAIQYVEAHRHDDERMI